MGSVNGKTEGGSGGKRGHSNMVHWDKTVVVKSESRRLRRSHDKQIVNKELNDLEMDQENDSLRPTEPTT